MSEEVRCDATVIDAQVGGLGRDETPCLAVTFQTNCEEFQQIVAKIFLTPAAEKMAAKSLTAMGWNPDAHNWDIDDLIEKNLLIGRKCSLVCVEEEYEGKWRWQVKWINSTTGAVLKTVFDSDARKRLTAEIRARKAPAAATGRGIARPGQVSQGQNVPPQSNPDGVPF